MSTFGLIAAADSWRRRDLLLKLYAALILFSIEVSPQAALPPTAASIRSAHLSRLDERLAIPTEDLRERCRFESDIATAPPSGLVALTFDDGPDAEHTRPILSILEHYGVPATFFLIGEKAEKHPELVQAIMADGRHLIGSHSWSHPNFHDLPEQDQTEEIEKGAAALPAGLSPRLFRYPYGNSSCAANDLLHGQGFAIVGWHVDSCDWAFDRTGTVDAKEAVSCGVSSQYRGDFVGHVAATVRARRGGIVLLHEIHEITPARLGEVIEEIRRDGFTFIRLDDPRLVESLR
jgi:peptidoglycan/xylan/chitin deacetylase (PgdA/CDA1 family)